MNPSLDPNVPAEVDPRPQPRPTHIQLPPLLRGGVRLLHRVAPSMAGRLAGELFSRPRKRALTENESRAAVKATPLRWRVRGHRLHGWRFGAADAPLVIGHHGWGGRGAQLAPWGPILADAGFRLVCYDAPAHGESSGHSTNLIEMTETLVAIDREHGPIRAIVTHSMGGMVAARAADRIASLRGIASIAPPGSMRPYLSIFAEALGVGPPLERSILGEIERRVGLRPRDLDCEAMIPTRALAFLLVYDTDDRDVPWQHARRWAMAWPQARVHETHGLGHRGLLRNVEVRRRVGEFLLDALSADGATSP